jgi:hypothetical protein
MSVLDEKNALSRSSTNASITACHFVAYHLPSPNARYCDQSGRTSICGEPTPCIAVVSQA